MILILWRRRLLLEKCCESRTWNLHYDLFIIIIFIFNSKN